MTFEEMVCDYLPLIHSLARKHKLNTPLYAHDDMVQEGLMKLYDVFSEFDDSYSPSTFITNVLRNHYHDLYRRENSQSRRNYDEQGNMVRNATNFDFDLIDSGQDLMKDLENEEVLRGVYQTLEEKSDRDKDIIQSVLDGETNDSVGQRYNVSKQRVNKIYMDFIEEVKQ